MRGGWLAWAGGNIDKQTLDLSIHLSAGMSASLFPYSKYSYALYFHDICQFKPSQKTQHATSHITHLSVLCCSAFPLLCGHRAWAVWISEDISRGTFLKLYLCRNCWHVCISFIAVPWVYRLS